MKKFFMTLAVAATAFMATTANAQTTEKFTDDLAISLNGAPQEPVKGTTVELEHQADGTSTFMLKNFTFGVFEVGDVIVEGIKGVKNGDATTYDFDGTAKLPSNTTLAEALGHQIPLTLHSVVEGGKLYAEISLSVPMGEETLKVDCVFGKKSETAINGVVAGKTAPAAVFNTTGARQNGLQKGLNIVRTADGKTVKVLK
ncbi:calycin-like domain-containing protein [Leyella stercorea]|uniref:calycin-like domain-containing protein n=1 Tax=Leyella stercorea TaxID=363265 RepID=UPI001A5BDF50|nr:calycin-like domain-containing protein [Leyella stercorea]MBL6518208.1 calycin-like domain-containing protein [Leyella stercorea]